MSDLVSIIMPVYNAESFISMSIESVLDQTYQNWELLIINDGSTDRVKETILKYSDRRVRYFEQENSGVSAARNIGLNSMKGDYFCFLDADDRLPANSLLSRLEVFNKNHTVTFVDGQIQIYDANMLNIVDWRSQSFLGPPLEALISIDTSCFFGPTWMIKREQNKTYGFNENVTHGEELLFYISIANGGYYSTTPDSIYHYRSGHISAMSDLQGLKHGYASIYKQLYTFSYISSEQRGLFKKKIKSIMFKSFLGQFKLYSAIKTWIEFGQL